MAFFHQKLPKGSLLPGDFFFLQLTPEVKEELDPDGTGEAAGTIRSTKDSELSSSYLMRQPLYRSKGGCNEMF